MELKRIIKDQEVQKGGKTAVNFDAERRKVMKTQQVDHFDDRR
jgi:hypothetical protein